MPSPRISLCIITGNESCHILRFLAAFAPAFDELCIVQAVGNAVADDTMVLANKWCDDNGKEIRSGEYLNEKSGMGSGAVTVGTVLDGIPETWPHVDDFGRARNQSWSMATGDWQFWADLDDMIEPEAAFAIRGCAERGTHDIFLFKYQIPTSDESNMRERLFRRGISRWVQPVHEVLSTFKELKEYKVQFEPGIIYTHAPMGEKARDPMRNLRILRYALRYFDGLAVDLHREAFIHYMHKRTGDYRDEALKWAERSEKAIILDEQRVLALMNTAQIIGDENPKQAIELCWRAIELTPWCRECWGWLAEMEIAAGFFRRADFTSSIMAQIGKVADSGLPQSDRFFGFQGFTLRTRALRANKREDAAREAERTMLKGNGCRIALIHATRGRALEAMRARHYWLQSARIPLGIEHIFGVDEDDEIGMKATAYYRRVVIPKDAKPGGCVAAWNAAAAVSEADILVQLSDDWVPFVHWDDAIVNAVAEVTGPNRAKPVVLGVSDGRRTDNLLCMAILNRARYEQQGHVVFSPEYSGVFSDDEFSWLAIRDKVVHWRRDLQFAHQHPLFAGVALEKMDDTYQRQNDPKRYKEGFATFARRNPDAPKDWKTASAVIQFPPSAGPSPAGSPPVGT